MILKNTIFVVALVCGMVAAVGAFAGEAGLVGKPVVGREGGGVTIGFAVSGTTDVEVAVLGAEGKVVRHLAAGVLGGEKAPPEPLVAGLAQKVIWDGKDDFGKAAEKGPFQVRVRAGMGVKFGRLIGEDPCNFGIIDGLVTDEEGQVYIKGFGGEANQSAMNVRVFDGEGKYVKEILPFPADLSPGAMKDVARLG